MDNLAKANCTIMEIMKLTIKEDFHRGTVFSSFSYHKITLFEFSLYTAEIKTLYFVFNCFAEDLLKLISNKFRMVCKVDGNLQLD